MSPTVNAPGLSRTRVFVPEPPPADPSQATFCVSGYTTSAILRQANCALRSRCSHRGAYRFLE
ncbi:hypothetical protein C8Q73DRAFT_690766 [Cubamyces lactineus]|nr:hypothetical protein C8Q73DRAFT_690766 [Cubamyces lactineus]